LFNDARRSNLIKDKQYPKLYLTLDGYKGAFKTLGIDLTKSPFKWSEVKKLQLFRNAIAHHGGVVTHDYENRLGPHGYKLGDTIIISDDYFRSSIALVREIY
jgi:hypothetical protein